MGTDISVLIGELGGVACNIIFRLTESFKWNILRYDSYICLRPNGIVV